MTSSLVITNNDTLNHLNDYKDKHIDSIAKVNWFQIHYLLEKLNATMNFSIMSTWGYYNKTSKQWSGMIGQLDRHEADIGGTALFLTPDRVAIIEYLSMATPTRAKFVFRAPPLSYVANIYTLPFNTKVWMSLGGFLVLITIVVYLTYSFEEYIRRNDNKWNMAKLTDIILLTVGAICQMGSHKEPKSKSGRVATMFLFITLLFLYTSYTANIVALLQSTTNSIRTLEDLLKSQLEFGVDDTPYNHYYFSVNINQKKN